MTTDEIVAADRGRTAGALSAWQEVGDARADQPEAVQALYKTLQPGVVSECERARKRIRGGYAEYVHGLKDARDALAPSRKFKEWCLAWGFNYGTVCNTLSLAGKRATNEIVSPRPKPEGKRAQLAIRLADDVTKATLVARLRAVLLAVGVETDEWGEAVLFLLTFFEEHQARARAAAAEAA